MDVDVVRALYEQGKSGQVLAAYKNEEQPPPGALFFISAALINLGREGEAKGRLEAGLPYVDDKALEADFLALLAFLQA